MRNPITQGICWGRKNAKKLIFSFLFLFAERSNSSFLLVSAFFLGRDFVYGIFVGKHWRNKENEQWGMDHVAIF
jgi:hypothetical protein